MIRCAKACDREGCTFIALHAGRCYFCHRARVREDGCMWVEDVQEVVGEVTHGYATFVDVLPKGMKAGDTLWQNGAPFDLVAIVYVLGKDALLLEPSKLHGKLHPEVGRTLSP